MFSCMSLRLLTKLGFREILSPYELWVEIKVDARKLEKVEEGDVWGRCDIS